MLAILFEIVDSVISQGPGQQKCKTKEFRSRTIQMRAELPELLPNPVATPQVKKQLGASLMLHTAILQFGRRPS